jgi:hypothetical protein
MKVRRSVIHSSDIRNSISSFETVINDVKIHLVGPRGVCIFNKVQKINKKVKIPSNRNVIDGVTIALTTSNNNRANNSRNILVVTLK